MASASHVLTPLFLQDAICQTMDWGSHRRLCEPNPGSPHTQRAFSWAVQFIGQLIPIAVIGLGGDIARRDCAPQIAWAQRVDGKTLRVNLNLVGPKDETDHQHLAFASVAVVSLDDVADVQPGTRCPAINLQIRKYPGDHIPISLVTYADGIPVDLTTVNIYFDIDAPFPFPPGMTLDAAIFQLQAITN